MKKIQLDGIQAGTKYTQDVFIDGKNLFVPAGVSVRQKDIDQLKRWGITQVQTDGEVMTDMPAGKAGPEIIDTRAFLKPNSVQANSEIYRLYVDMVEKLDAFFAQFSAGADNAKKTLDAVAGKSSASFWAVTSRAGPWPRARSTRPSCRRSSAASSSCPPTASCS
jgi:hypothetical protein